MKNEIVAFKDLKYGLIRSCSSGIAYVRLHEMWEEEFVYGDYINAVSLCGIPVHFDPDEKVELITPNELTEEDLIHHYF